LDNHEFLQKLVHGNAHGSFGRTSQACQRMRSDD
jgi:hypothetical protein